MKYFSLCLYGLLSCAALSYAMEPTVLISGWGTIDDGTMRYQGVLSNGSNVEVKLYTKSLRSGIRCYCVGKIGKKKLMGLQARHWLKKLEEGADYSVASAAIEYFIREQDQ